MRSARGWSSGFVLFVGAVSLMVALQGCANHSPGGDAAASSSDGRSAVTISSMELARRLAALIWLQVPDDALLASIGALPTTTAEDVRRLASQMLTDGRAHAGVGAFYRIWLKLELVASLQKDPQLFPDFSPDLATAMATEPERFGVFVTLDGDHRYPTLMTASFSFVNGPLAGVYGLPGVTGPDFQKTDLDAKERAGVLTQPGLLAMTHSTQNASASARGLFVVNQFLCMPFPPSPPGEALGEPPPNMTNRQWIESATRDGSCRACHNVIDPLGYALGNFDAIGRYGTTDHGLPVDASGTVTTRTDGVADQLTFSGPIELAALMATRPEAQNCFAQQWLKFALGRDLTTADDSSLADIEARFRAADLSIPALIAAVAGSSAFLAP